MSRAIAHDSCRSLRAAVDPKHSVVTAHCRVGLQRGAWEGILCAGYKPKPVTGSTGNRKGPAAIRIDRGQVREAPKPTHQGLRQCTALQGLQDSLGACPQKTTCPPR